MEHHIPEEQAGGGESNYSGNYKGNAGSSVGGAGGKGSTHSGGSAIPLNGGGAGNPAGTGTRWNSSC